MRTGIETERDQDENRGTLAVYTGRPYVRAFLCGDFESRGRASQQLAVQRGALIDRKTARCIIVNSQFEVLFEGTVENLKSAGLLGHAVRECRHDSLTRVVALPLSWRVPTMRLEKEIRDCMPGIEVISKKELSTGERLDAVKDWLDRADELLGPFASEGDEESDSAFGDLDAEESTEITGFRHDPITVVARGDAEMEEALRTLFPYAREVIAAAVTTSDERLASFLIRNASAGSAALFDQLKLRDLSSQRGLSQFGMQVGLAAAEVVRMTRVCDRDQHKLSVDRDEQNVAYLESFGPKVSFVPSSPSPPIAEYSSDEIDSE